MKKVYIVDMDGTLYRGEKPIDGAAEFIKELLEREYILMTNCPINSPGRLSEKLAAMNIRVPPEKIINSGQLSLGYLQSAGIGNIFMIGSPDLRAMTAEYNIALTNIAPQAVLIGQDDNVTEAELCFAENLLASGIPGYCTNIDLHIPCGDRLIPHTGTLVHRLKRSAPNGITNLGKPQKGFLQLACQMFDCCPADICLVGDNLYTDIAMGVQYGTVTYLVLTGISNEYDNVIKAFPPTKIFQNLNELMDFEFSRQIKKEVV